MTDMHRALAQMAYDSREETRSHLHYDRETAFYRSIQAGDRENALRFFTPLEEAGFGVLSEDPLRNLQYHVVITVAFITRYCMAGGMPVETALSLSDLYIRRIDRCTAPAEVHALHRELVGAYAERMHALARRRPYSRPVQKCTAYIHAHLHERITVEALCGVSGLSRSYLSRLFRQETGLTLQQYVTQQKLEAAREALEFTDQPITALAQVLAFSSESHFISAFRQHMGVTPGEYRRQRQNLPPMPS